MGRRTALRRVTSLARPAGVVIRPAGGIGNQMFIYGAGRALAHRLAAPLLIDTRAFTDRPAHPYELAHLEISGTVLPSAVGRGWPGLAQAPIGESRIDDPDLGALTMYREASSAEYDPGIEGLRTAVVLNGHFTSWRYLRGAESIIAKELGSLATRSAWYSERSAHLGAAAPWIAVHVRRGDYTRPPFSQLYGVLAPDYYARAIERVAGLTGADYVVAFSDDEGAVIRELGHLVDEVIEHPADRPAVESLHLMAQADGIVISNSTFSWWAAWLGGGQVIAPSPWHERRNKNLGDLLPEAWHRLPAWD